MRFISSQQAVSRLNKINVAIRCHIINKLQLFDGLSFVDFWTNHIVSDIQLQLRSCACLLKYDSFVKKKKTLQFQQSLFWLLLMVWHQLWHNVSAHHHASTGILTINLTTQRYITVLFFFAFFLCLFCFAFFFFFIFYIWCHCKLFKIFQQFTITWFGCMFWTISWFSWDSCDDFYP